MGHHALGTILSMVSAHQTSCVKGNKTGDWKATGDADPWGGGLRTGGTVSSCSRMEYAMSRMKHDSSSRASGAGSVWRRESEWRLASKMKLPKQLCKHQGSLDEKSVWREVVWWSGENEIKKGEGPHGAGLHGIGEDLGLDP